MSTLVADAIGNFSRERRGPVFPLDPGTKPALLCGNGPSLLRDLPLIRREDYGQVVAVNGMASTEYFESLRPTSYFIQDRYWFHKEPYYEDKVQNVFRALNEKVSWEMILCIPSKYDHAFRTIHPISNSWIKVRYFDGPLLKSGLRTSRLGTVNSDFNLRTQVLMSLWNRRLLYPPLEGVASTALFELIRTHPLQIDLVGLDMTMGRDLCVDNSGSLKFIPSHFYGKSADAIPDYGPTTSTAAAYLWLSKKFHIFNLLREFADAQGVRVFNRTSDTLLDGFPVRSLAEGTREN